jgi:N utilization substance protein A
MQQSLSLKDIIDQVSKEKGIDSKVLTETMEQAILTAAKRTFGADRELSASYNEETGNVDLFQYMLVVENVENAEREMTMEDAAEYKLEAAVGDDIGFQIFYTADDEAKARQQDKEFGELLMLQQYRHGFGRIAAQTAKQVIIQRVRDAERELIFNEYKDRKGEIITGMVRRFERGNNIVVDLGRTEAILPSREQTPRESYRPGDRIVAFVKDIDREARGPQIILSRTDVGLLVKLFEMEVPEIYEGIVRIVAAAREPGARSKIAVSSRDNDVDPVGACVGMKGSRVQAVVQELRGEKIDIVPWDRDPARFVCNAIAPAEVARVIIDEANGGMELVVPDEKLSLAIGRRGQNVRLASQLTGWKLDIIGESKFKQMEEEAISALAMIDGVEEHVARTMYKLGFRTLDEVAEASEQELGGIPGLGGPSNAAKIKDAAETATEKYRQIRVKNAATRADSLTDKERMLLVSGVSERNLELLEAAGYRTVDDIAKEDDVDRLAIKTNIGTKRAKQIKDGAAHFLSVDAKSIDEGRKAARARADEEQKARAAEAAEAAEAAAAAAAAAAPAAEPTQENATE